MIRQSFVRASGLALAALAGALAACGHVPGGVAPGTYAAPGTSQGAGQSPPESVGGRPVSRLRGSFTYFADTGLFSDCETGKVFHVAAEGDNRRLERAYGAARAAPGAPVVVAVDGFVTLRKAMEGSQSQATLVVERFVAVERQGSCAGPGTASLENTYWKLVRLQDKPISVAERQPEPHLILQPANERRVTGSGGCNRFTGGYSLDDDRIRFTRLAGTRMACAQGAEQEQAFLKALGAVGRWRVTGERLDLFGADGERLQFEAVYLR